MGRHIRACTPIQSLISSRQVICMLRVFRFWSACGGCNDGACPVKETPADDVTFRRLTSWPSRLRIPSRRSRHQPPIVDDPSSTLPSTELPPPSPEPVHLTVLTLMSTPFADTKAGKENGGRPVVELGVAEVAYT